jgi:hypothetical protein
LTFWSSAPEKPRPTPPLPRTRQVPRRHGQHGTAGTPCRVLGFTGGAFRFVDDGIAGLLKQDLTIADLEPAHIDFGVYTAEEYFDDTGRLTEYRRDPT